MTQENKHKLMTQDKFLEIKKRPVHSICFRSLLNVQIKLHSVLFSRLKLNIVTVDIKYV